MRVKPHRSKRYTFRAASMGGKARAAKLSAERRREIAVAAAIARWGKVARGAGYPQPVPLPPENGPKDPLMV